MMKRGCDLRMIWSLRTRRGTTTGWWRGSRVMLMKMIMTANTTSNNEHNNDNANNNNANTNHRTWEFEDDDAGRETSPTCTSLHIHLPNAISISPPLSRCICLSPPLSMHLLVWPGTCEFKRFSEFCWNAPLGNLEFDETVPLCASLAYQQKQGLRQACLGQQISMRLPTVFSQSLRLAAGPATSAFSRAANRNRSKQETRKTTSAKILIVFAVSWATNRTRTQILRHFLGRHETWERPSVCAHQDPGVSGFDSRPNLFARVASPQEEGLARNCYTYGSRQGG